MKTHFTDRHSVEALLLVAALSASAAAQAQVTTSRSLTIEQTGPAAYEVTCSVEYSGVDPSHYFFMGTNVADMSSGGGFQTMNPWAVEVGPGKDRVVTSEPGVWKATNALHKGKKTLTSETRYFMNRAPDTSTYIVCEGSGYDRSTATALPRVRLVEFGFGM